MLFSHTLLYTRPSFPFLFNNNNNNNNNNRKKYKLWKTGPGIHPASSTMDTGSSFSGLKLLERGAQHVSALALRLKKE
jgi:hypothetical protein